MTYKHQLLTVCLAYILLMGIIKYLNLQGKFNLNHPLSGRIHGVPKIIFIKKSSKIITLKRGSNQCVQTNQACKQMQIFFFCEKFFLDTLYIYNKPGWHDLPVLSSQGICSMSRPYSPKTIFTSEICLLFSMYALFVDFKLSCHNVITLLKGVLWEFTWGNGQTSLDNPLSWVPFSFSSVDPIFGNR